MQDLAAPRHDPRPGIKPMSPALASGFLTTGPPGKSSVFLKKRVFFFFKARTGNPKSVKIHALHLVVLLLYPS